MSDLSNPKEAAEWISSWIGDSSPVRCLKVFELAAKEQRANMEACRAKGWDVRAYERSVQMIEESIPPARARAFKWERNWAARLAAEKEAQDRMWQEARERNRRNETLRIQDARVFLGGLEESLYRRS